MRLHQHSAFIENRPAQLCYPRWVLADAGVDLVTLSLADRKDFGILRLIVRDWRPARDALTKAGLNVE